MGMIRKAVFAALAAKGVDWARKPENQQKVREFIESRRGQGHGQGAMRGMSPGAARRASAAQSRH